MVIIDKDACIGCGRCVADCISNSLSIENNKAQSSGNCLLCGHCVAVCPAGAVSIPEYDMEDVEELSPEEATLETGRLLKAIKFRRSIRSYKQMPVRNGPSVAGRASARHCQEYPGMPFYLCAGRAGFVQVHDMGRNRTDPE